MPAALLMHKLVNLPTALSEMHVVATDLGGMHSSYWLVDFVIQVSLQGRKDFGGDTITKNLTVSFHGPKRVSSKRNLLKGL